MQYLKKYGEFKINEAIEEDFPIQIGDHTITFDDYKEGIKFVKIYLYDNDELAEEKFFNLVDVLKKYQKQGGEIYRVIFVKDESDINYDNLGIHWSYNFQNLKEIADDLKYLFFSENNLTKNEDEMNKYKTFIITGKIESDSIDIEETLNTFYVNPNEDELWLKSNADVDVKNIEKFN